MKTLTKYSLGFISLVIQPFMIANANTFEVNVTGLSFEPKIISIQPGDTIQWNGMTGHSTTMVAELSPDDALKWDSTIGEDFERTFEKEGVYIYKCKPHSSFGMAGAVIVGKPTNLEKLKKVSHGHDLRKLIDEIAKK